MVYEWVSGKVGKDNIWWPFLVVPGGNDSLHAPCHCHSICRCKRSQWTWSLFLECRNICDVCVCFRTTWSVVKQGEGRHLKLDRSGSKFLFWLSNTVRFWVNCFKTTITLISRLFHECFLWGSYPVLCSVNKWIRNSDKRCFLSQSERERACGGDQEVTSQLQIWRKLRDGAPADIPSSTLPAVPWATVQRPPGHLERATQSHRTKQFCFLKNQNQGSSWSHYWELTVCQALF